jgi:hypothetical protein
VVTPARSVLLLKVNTWTCKLLMSIFTFEPLASAFYSVYILEKLMCVHVCSCITCIGGSHVLGSYVGVPNSHKHAVQIALCYSASGGPGLIHSRGMPVLGPLN